MEDHPTLSNNIPRIAPPRLHARKPSRSPTRNRLGDDLLADLSPATTLEAFTSPSGKLKASIEAATPSERAFGLRATIASKKIQEWVTELSDWQWPAQGGSVGFEIPAAKRRKLTTPSAEPRSMHTGFEGSADQTSEEGRYIGSLLAEVVERYEDRIDEITDEMDDLNVEEIKRQVLDTHFSPRSRPSSSASNAPPMPSLFASYTKMDDFTAVVTATVLQALPNLSRLMRLMEVWTIRLNVLHKVPPLLRALDDAEMALRSGWNGIKPSGQDGLSELLIIEEQTLSRQTFLAMMGKLQRKVTSLGKDFDFMLDTLEGREDTLPDSWLDRMDLIERDYGEWVVAGERKVREGEWAAIEKKRREEEEARRLKEAELARLKAEQEALEAARLKALKDAAEAEAARLDALAKEAARVKVEEEALEAARLEALREAEIAEAARIDAERESREILRREAEQALEAARLQSLKEAEIADNARIETARIQAEREAQDLARRLAEEEALELSRLEALRKADVAEAARLEAARAEDARLQAEQAAQDNARRKAEQDALAKLEALRVAECARIEAARAKAEQEAKEIARQKAEEERSAKSKALQEAAIAQAARVEAERKAQQKIKEEALEVIRVQALKEAEATRLKAEYEAQVLAASRASEEILEAARLKSLRDFEEAEVARLQAKQEAEESAREKAQFEAAEFERKRLENEALEAVRLKALKEAEEERLRVEREFAAVEKLRMQQELQEAERLRIEQEEQEIARLNAVRELEEAQAIETARLKAERDAEDARRFAEHDAELRRIKEEEVALEAARLLAEKEALETARVRAQEAAELARQKAEQDATNAAKLKAEQDKELARLNAEREAQELARLQAEKEAEIQKMNAEKEAEIMKQKTEHDARIKKEEATQAARMQDLQDIEDASRLKAKRDAELARIESEKAAAEHAQRSEREAPDAESGKQDAVRWEHTDSNHLESSQSLQDSRQWPVIVAGADTAKEAPMDSDITSASPVNKIAASSIKSSIQTTMGVVPSSVAIGVGIASLAYLHNSKERANAAQQHEAASASDKLHCGCDAFDGPSGEVSEVLDRESHEEPPTSNDRLDIPQEMVMDTGIDSPIKLDAAEPRTPTLGSPIHFDEHFDSQMSLTSKPVFSSQSVLVEASESPIQSPQATSTDYASAKSLELSNTSDIKDTDNVAESLRHVNETKALDAAILSTSFKSLNLTPMYDGAGDAIDPTHSNSVGTGWIVINSSDDDGESARSAPLQDSDLSDHIFNSGLRLENDSSLEIQDLKDELLSSYTEAEQTLSMSETESAKQLQRVQAPVKTLSPEKGGDDFEYEPTHVSTTPIDLSEWTKQERDTDIFTTPSKVSQLSDNDVDEVEDLSSILSPVPEEELMPSIEVDSLDGSCAACDSYIGGDEEDDDMLPARTRNTSIGYTDIGVRRISRPHQDSISSDTSTIINSRIGEVPSSPIGSPQLDSSFLDSFSEDIEQSPSAGRVGHRSRGSYEFSPPPSPSATPRLSKQRSLQVLKTPGFGSTDSTAPSTPLEAPSFDNVDITAAPLLASPKKNSNDEQLQQQISSLLEKIPARIRLTSDMDSTPFASQTIRPKKTRRSVTPSFRPSSSMSNYSTYSRAPTPSFTLAPAFSKTTQRSRGSVGNPEIKLYHLSRSTGEAPIKLFVRLVGENGERVMVRVGGGWADLGEYLKEYASHHGRRSTVEGGEKIEIQDLPSRVVSGSSVSSNTTVRENGRTPSFSRPSSVMDNRPGSSLNVRKTRKSVGATDVGKVPPRLSDIRNDDQSPSTPLPSINRRSYDTPPSAASITSSSASGTGPSAASGRSSRLSWAEEDSSLGLAGPKAKKIIISERDQEWVESMKEKVKLASAEKERRTRERERLDRERERKTSFGEMDKVGGTKRLFRKSLAEKVAVQKNEKNASS